MNRVVERLYEQNMAQKRFLGAGPDFRIIGEKETGEDQLQGNLSPHVHVVGSKILLLLTLQLLASDLVEVVVLVDKLPMQRQDEMSADDTGNRNGVQWPDRSDLVEQGRRQKEKPIILRVAFQRRVSRRDGLTLLDGKDGLDFLRCRVVDFCFWFHAHGNVVSCRVDKSGRRLDDGRENENVLSIQ